MLYFLSGPDKVAFMVKNSAALQNIPSKSVIVYNTVVTNLGNGYDSSNGIFTAPSNGIYIFSWTVLCHFGKTFNTYLILNGSTIAKNFAAARSVAVHASGSKNVILDIKKYLYVSKMEQLDSTCMVIVGLLLVDTNYITCKIKVASYFNVLIKKFCRLYIFIILLMSRVCGQRLI